MRLLSLLLIALFMASCGGGTPFTARPALANRPVMVWLDAATFEPLAASDPRALESWIAAAQSAGVTHIGIERIGWNGEPAFAPKSEAAKGLTKAMTGRPLTPVAIIPCFVPRAKDGPELTAAAAHWTGTAWHILPLSPPRLTPAAAVARERVLAAASEAPESIILLSGFGFGDQFGDLSPAGRREFESWTAEPVRNWPADVIGPAGTANAFGPEGRGPLWTGWTHWRADLLKRLLLQVRSQAGASRSIGVLVDAPYSMHQREGFNWAVAGQGAATDHPWLGRQYEKTESGHLVDFLAQVYWYPGLLRREQAEEQQMPWWASMEGAAIMGGRVIGTGTQRWAVVPAGDREAWPQAVRTARRLHHGVVLSGVQDWTADGEEWRRLKLALTDTAAVPVAE